MIYTLYRHIFYRMIGIANIYESGQKFTLNQFIV